MSSFPLYSAQSLAKLQQADPEVATFLKYWYRAETPNHEEQLGELSRTLELVHQWERMVESDGVLYHQRGLGEGPGSCPEHCRGRC